MRKDPPCLKRYYQDVAATPLLTPAEEKSLARRYRNGDMEARTALMKANLRFVIKMAMAYEKNGMALEDLIQEGNIGLLDGIERFNPEMGFRLTTYVSHWIRLAIQRAIEQKAQQIRIPANKVEQIKRIRKFKNSFEQQHSRPPTVSEIARGLEMRKPLVALLETLETTYFSLEQAPAEQTNNLLNVLENTQVEHPHEQIAETEMRDKVYNAMQVLTDKEKDIIIHRFGLNGNPSCLSLRQVGRLMGLSAEGVRRIEETALKKLRRPAVSAQFEGFI